MTDKNKQSSLCNCELLPHEHEVCQHPIKQSELPPWYQPLTVGDWSTDEWKAAIDAVFAKRKTYAPDSLSAIFRDIATDAYCQLLQVQRERDEARRIVSQVNNSLFGSETYFIDSPNCVDECEKRKTEAKRTEAALAAAKERIEELEDEVRDITYINNHAIDAVAESNSLSQELKAANLRAEEAETVGFNKGVDAQRKAVALRIAGESLLRKPLKEILESVLDVNISRPTQPEPKDESTKK